MELFLALKSLVGAVLVPPTGLFVAALMLMFWRSAKVRRHAASASLQAKRGAGLQASAMLMLFAGLAFSTNGVGNFLMEHVEALGGPALSPKAISAWRARSDAPQAVVVLAGGLNFDLREPESPLRPSWRSMQRLLYGARVARQAELPVLLTGGVPSYTVHAEAQAMADMMVRDLSLKPRWVETASRDTRDNAVMSARLLQADGVRRIVLVTHAAHMARSVIEFERAGLVVVPAPMGYQASIGTIQSRTWWPTPDGAVKTWYALHEWLGLLWYRVSAPR